MFGKQTKEQLSKTTHTTKLLCDRMLELENKYNSEHNRINRICDYMETDFLNNVIKAVSKYLDKLVKEYEKTTTKRKK